MTEDELIRAKQSPAVAQPAVAFAAQTPDQRAKLSGEGWRRMIVRYKMSTG